MCRKVGGVNEKKIYRENESIGDNSPWSKKHVCVINSGYID